MAVPPGIHVGSVPSLFEAETKHEAVISATGTALLAMLLAVTSVLHCDFPYSLLQSCDKQFAHLHSSSSSYCIVGARVTDEVTYPRFSECPGK